MQVIGPDAVSAPWAGESTDGPFGDSVRTTRRAEPVTRDLL
ncbi:hypothetical protein AB0L57_17040 [Nocardia sp. NPDC052254]